LSNNQKNISLIKQPNLFVFYREETKTIFSKK
jgi:hypothetical protein